MRAAVLNAVIVGIHNGGLLSMVEAWLRAGVLLHGGCEPRKTAVDLGLQGAWRELRSDFAEIYRRYDMECTVVGYCCYSSGVLSDVVTHSQCAETELRVNEGMGT